MRRNGLKLLKHLEISGRCQIAWGWRYYIRIKCPKNSGAEYFSYKCYCSLVLMAFVESNYRFNFADVGSQGSVSDGGVFRRTSLWKALEDKTLNIPPPKALPQNRNPIFEDEVI